MSLFKNVTFHTTVASLNDLPADSVCEIAFAGRSNVGKSSLLNKMVGIRRLAKTSNTPGRTREINFFDLDDQYYFADLPGYGYAKVPLAVKGKWSAMMEKFFYQAEGLRLVVILIDVRRDPTPEDHQMISWLEAAGLPYIFAITKIDKVSRAQLAQRLSCFQQVLDLEDDNALIPVSSQTGAGVDQLLGVVHECLKSDPPATED